jgi:hypothetical protein
MAIKLTDELTAATEQGKLGAAKQIYLEGDVKNLQDRDAEVEEALTDMQARIEQNKQTIEAISVQGGANTAEAVTYNSTESGMEATNLQQAVDKIAARVTATESQAATIDEHTKQIESLTDETKQIGEKISVLDGYQIVETTEFIFAIVDADNNVAFGIRRADGSVVIPKGQAEDTITALRQLTSRNDKAHETFTSDIEEIKGEVSEQADKVQQVVDDMQSFTDGLTSERQAREQADTALSERIDTEQQARAEQVVTLQTLINTEQEERESDTQTLSDNIAALQSTLGSEISTLATDGTAARDKMQADINSNTDKISEVSGNLSSEITARQQADDSLRQSITQEAATRTAEDKKLDERISTEESAREQADTAEATARANADIAEEKARINADADEAAKREQADTAEATARTNADAELQKNIDSEAKSRQAADKTLTDNLAATNTNVATLRAEYDAAIGERAMISYNEENEEFIHWVVDRDGVIVFGVRTNGELYAPKGNTEEQTKKNREFEKRIAALEEQLAAIAATAANNE